MLVCRRKNFASFLAALALTLCVHIGAAKNSFGHTLAPAGNEGAASGTALIGGHFDLVDTHNKPVTEKDFAGQYMLVFFGFTSCPDECPTLLTTIQNTFAELGDTAKQITPIFITVDPEYDTPKVMAAYVAHFGPRIVGLTGSAAQIKQAVDAYKVYASKRPSHGAAKSEVEHSAFLYLMGPDGRYITHFPATISAPQLKKALQKQQAVK